LNLKVGQFDKIAGSLRLDTSKNGEPRVSAVTSLVKQLLIQCVAGKKADAYILTRGDGKRVSAFRMTWQNCCVAAGVGKMVCRVCGTAAIVHGKRRFCPKCETKRSRARLKYVGLIPHSLRRTSARDMSASGVPEHVIMACCGWKTASMFRRYAITNIETTVSAMAKLDAKRQRDREQLARDKTEFGDGLVTVGAKTAEMGPESVASVTLKN
jgi:integrase